MNDPTEFIRRIQRIKTEIQRARVVSKDLEHVDYVEVEYQLGYSFGQQDSIKINAPKEAALNKLETDIITMRRDIDAILLEITSWALNVE